MDKSLDIDAYIANVLLTIDMESLVNLYQTDQYHHNLIGSNRMLQALSQVYHIPLDSITNFPDFVRVNYALSSMLILKYSDLKHIINDGQFSTFDFEDIDNTNLGHFESYIVFNGEYTGMEYIQYYIEYKYNVYEHDIEYEDISASLSHLKISNKEYIFDLLTLSKYLKRSLPKDSWYLIPVIMRIFFHHILDQLSSSEYYAILYFYLHINARYLTNLLNIPESLLSVSSTVDDVENEIIRLYGEIDRDIDNLEVIIERWIDSLV